MNSFQCLNAGIGRATLERRNPALQRVNLADWQLFIHLRQCIPWALICPCVVCCRVRTCELFLETNAHACQAQHHFEVQCTGS